MVVAHERTGGWVPPSPAGNGPAKSGCPIIPPPSSPGPGGLGANSSVQAANSNANKAVVQTTRIAVFQPSNSNLSAVSTHVPEPGDAEVDVEGEGGPDAQPPHQDEAGGIGEAELVELLAIEETVGLLQ